MEFIRQEPNGDYVYKCPLCLREMVRHPSVGIRIKTCGDCKIKGRTPKEYSIIKKIGSSYVVAVTYEVRKKRLKVGDKVKPILELYDDGSTNNNEN